MNSTRRIFLTAVVLTLAGGMLLALLFLVGGLSPVYAANSQERKAWLEGEELSPQANTYFTVTIATDEKDNSCSDGDCSLRDAILLANRAAGDKKIHFNISGCPGSVCTILPTLGFLPSITGTNITIDGYTQSGAAPATGSTPATIKIEINGTGVAFNGFNVLSSGNTIRGLAINRIACPYGGISIWGANANNNTVSGNHIGTNPGGTAAQANCVGVILGNNAHHNTIGGDEPAERNLISGNTISGVGIGATLGVSYPAMTNTVSGNYIGTNALGTGDLGNAGSGVYIDTGSQFNVIGGDMAGERNVIAGNNTDGVYIHGNDTTDNTVFGNYIGTNATGLADLGNSNHGVNLDGGAQFNTIGGDTPGERNIISGNGPGGPSVDSSGVRLYGSETMSNTISGNFIGVNVSGTLDLGNSFNGVYITNDAQGNLIGGDVPGERNVISGNDDSGIFVNGNRNVISGNYIGTDTSGLEELGNGDFGVYVNNRSLNVIGGDTAGERNVISANGNHGIYLYWSQTMSTTVLGNYIGLDANGTGDLGNYSFGVAIGYGAKDNTIGPNNFISCNSSGNVRLYFTGTTGNVVVGNYIGTDRNGANPPCSPDDGIEMEGGVQDTTIGPGNVLAYNFNGVIISGSDTERNLITQNSIYSSDELGIDLVDDGNNDIAAPVILATTLGSVNVSGTACASCTVEVFANPDMDGEGKYYQGSSTANGSGVFTITTGFLDGRYLTATATNSSDGTSEFSEVFTSTIRNVFLPLVLKQ